MQNSNIVFDADGWKSSLRGFSNRTWFIVVDDNTRIKCLPIVEALYLESRQQYHVIQVAQGEAHKTIGSASFVWSRLLELGAERNDLIIGLGGGVVTDLSGFVASTYKRGVALALIPTTYLAMCDAAHGGKTGLNVSAVKNAVGTFHQPVCTLIDPSFLQSLEKTELLNGYFETLKHALIADAQFWNTLVRKDWWVAVHDIELIKRSVRIKTDVVTGDERDYGQRQKLNFGHTVGHAIEGASGGGIRHGFAVGVGMICEMNIATKLGLLKNEVFEEVAGYLIALLPQVATELPAPDRVIEFMRHDKKNDSSHYLMSLIDNIGSCKTGIEVSHEQVRTAYAESLNLLRK
ncbi:MAG: 3-dehydroquinate synthase [Salibacteraceae bacterium]